MIVLSRLLLINWHNINLQTLEFSDINFLTGPTGSGKSTSIDALQIIFLGKTDGTFFNKAAAAKSEKKQQRRTLKGYVYNRIGAVREEDDQDSVYMRRGCFSSYIVAEFKEETLKAESVNFCFGAVFDCNYPDDPTKKFFFLANKLPENRFVENGVPIPGYELAKYLQNTYGKKKFEVFSSEQLYRGALRLALGNLKERFHEQFRRAVPFDPSIDLGKFLSDFACDVDTGIDIGPMQESVAHYTQLCLASERVKGQIAVLSEICQNHANYVDNEVKARLYQYVVDRGTADHAATKLREARERQEAANTELVEQEAAIPCLIEAEEEARDQRERASTAYYKEQAAVENREEYIDQQIARIDEDAKRIQEASKSLTAKLAEHRRHWQRVTMSLKALVSDREPILSRVGEFDKGIAKRMGDAIRELGKYEVDVASWIAVLGYSIESDELKASFNGIGTLRYRLGDLTKHATEVNTRVKEVIRRLDDSLEQLEQEIASLEIGVKPIELRLENFVADLGLAMGNEAKKANIRFVGDCFEVKDVEWQNAIEGYLGRRRFHILVQPESHKVAIAAYKRLKREKGYHSIGIIDGARILRDRQDVQRGSLAEELLTNDICAKAYADYVLGRVMKADNVETMDRYRTAMTKDCWRYQGYVRELLNPASYRDLYIGQKSLQLRLEKAHQERKSLLAKKSEFSSFVNHAERAAVGKEFSDSDIEGAIASITEVSKLPGLADTRMAFVLERGNIDKSRLVLLLAEKEEREKVWAEAVVAHKGAVSHVEALRDEIKRINALLPALATDNATYQNQLTRYNIDWVIFEAKPFYENYLEKVKDPFSAANNYRPQVSQFTNARDENLKKIRVLRLKYATSFADAATGLDLESPENEDWAAELKKLTESALPEYEDRISKAKERAYEQFQNDFLSRLYNNVSGARQQIKELSDALKDVSFGGGIRFRMGTEVNPKYKKVYDMIMDESLSQGQNIFSVAFQEKHGEVFEEFFRRFIPPDDERLTGNQVREFSDEAVKLTDYRTYLEFEMEEIQPDGRKISLTRSGGLRSGGEGQTVFYVSVLASFMKLYRVKNSVNNHTFRLVIFDEAFSKMDRKRINDSMEWLKETGLQVIIAAPPEKMVDIQPHANRTLVVSKGDEGTIIIPAEYKEVKMA